jgi:hypothetical protein
MRLVEALAMLPGRWPTLPIDEQQSVAKAVSARLGGLYADARKPGKLLLQDDVPSTYKVKIKNSFRSSLKCSIR